jgi:hypothetical protein
MKSNELGRSGLAGPLACLTVFAVLACAAFHGMDRFDAWWRSVTSPGRQLDVAGKRYDATPICLDSDRDEQVAVEVHDDGTLEANDRDGDPVDPVSVTKLMPCQTAAVDWKDTRTAPGVVIDQFDGGRFELTNGIWYGVVATIYPSGKPPLCWVWADDGRLVHSGLVPSDELRD